MFSANFLKQVREQKLKALVAAHGLTWSGDWYELSGDASDYVVSADSPIALTAEAKDWVARYREKFGKEPAVTTSGDQYDLIMVGIEVLRKAEAPLISRRSSISSTPSTTRVCSGPGDGRGKTRAERVVRQ